MIASIIVEDKRDLSNCVFNLLDKKDIFLSFKEDEIFMDRVDDMQGEILLQNIKGISKFIIPPGSEKYLNGITIKIDPNQFKNSLSMCNEDESFKIYICKELCKIIQGNTSCTFPIMEINMLEEVIYHSRSVESRMNPECIENCSILEIRMKEITDSLKKIARAERFEKFIPHYYVNFNQDKGMIGKGDIRDNYYSINLSDFKFSGKPVEIETSGKLEKVIGIFKPKQKIIIKCYKDSLLHFSQAVSLNTKIDYIISGMST